MNVMVRSPALVSPASIRNHVVPKARPRREGSNRRVDTSPTRYRAVSLDKKRKHDGASCLKANKCSSWIQVSFLKPQNLLLNFGGEQLEAKQMLQATTSASQSLDSQDDCGSRRYSLSSQWLIGGIRSAMYHTGEHLRRLFPAPVNY